MILDSHVHCGITLPFEIVRKEWDKANIDGGVLFSPVEEIYDRTNQNFTDSEFYKNSRKKVHSYLEKLHNINKNLEIFFFVWNDFELPWKNFKGIKWHRHSNEPQYNYTSKECDFLIEHICQNNLPVIIEEEFKNTLYFLKKINGRSPVIIPHLGFLNGGYEKIKYEGIFSEPNVYADTALADEWEIDDYAKNFGIKRLLFGSDFPFGSPYIELNKIKKIFNKTEEFYNITFKNLKNLL